MSKTAKVRGAAHQTRETEQRDAAPVHDVEDEPWQRGASLEMPPPRAGMEQRWIVFELSGMNYEKNFTRKKREGWNPRDPATVPDDFPMPTINHGAHSGQIVIEGSVLCERSVSIGKRRTKHFRQETHRRTDALKADLQRVNSENRNPAFGPIRMAADSKVVFEKRVPAVADD